MSYILVSLIKYLCVLPHVHMHKQTLLLFTNTIPSNVTQYLERSYIILSFNLLLSLFVCVFLCARETGVSLCSILCMVDKYKLICTRTCTCVEFYKYALFQFNSIRSLPIFVNGIHLFIPQSLYLYFCLYSIMPRADQCIHSRDSLTRQRSLGSSRGWLRTMRHLFMALFCR